MNSKRPRWCVLCLCSDDLRPRNSFTIATKTIQDVTSPLDLLVSRKGAEFQRSRSFGVPDGFCCGIVHDARDGLVIVNETNDQPPLPLTRRPLVMTPELMVTFLREANAVAQGAAAHGHHPFGALLVGPDDVILMRQGNINTVHHAESELARRAAVAFSPEFLWACTLVTTGEPCAMCCGTLYWANIGRLVYGFEETTLLALTGNHSANPTMNLPARTVLGCGQKNIEVYGPFPEIEEELIVPHRDFWKR